MKVHDVHENINVHSYKKPFVKTVIAKSGNVAIYLSDNQTSKCKCPVHPQKSMASGHIKIKKGKNLPFY